MPAELAHTRAENRFIFQTFNLLPRLTALANVELGMRYVDGADRKAAAKP
jgi:ABC-type lipoprotein export system ATPase subunit